MGVGDIYRVSIEGIFDGARCLNALHYQVNTSVGAAAGEAEALALSLNSACLVHYDDLISDDNLFDLVSVRGVTNPTLGFDNNISAIGQVSGEKAPNQLSALVMLRTGLIGRSFNGRFYAVPTVLANLDDNAWLAAYQTALDAMLTDMMATGATTGSGVYTFGLVVYSETLSVATPVNNIQVISTPRIQRRRRPGVGS